MMYYKIKNIKNGKFLKSHTTYEVWDKSMRESSLVESNYKNSLVFHNLEDCEKVLNKIKKVGIFELVELTEKEYLEWKKMI